MHKFHKTDITVSNSFIQKFAKKYVDERQASITNIRSLSNSFLFKSTGFDATTLEKIIVKNVIAEDKTREAGKTPKALNDIYRSDLGELLLTYYFEEKVAVNEQFKIPVKNITSRELSNLPGRGMDAIGYRIEGTKVCLLFGEAKVSHSKDSPPPVVHGTSDSIYNTHLNHRTNQKAVLKKLSEYLKRLSFSDASAIGVAILAIETGQQHLYEITFGSALIRDYTCVNDTSDYGKMESDKKTFEPCRVNFALLSFSNKTIEETVEMFYKEVYKSAA